LNYCQTKVPLSVVEAVNGNVKKPCCDAVADTEASVTFYSSRGVGDRPECAFSRKAA
jgi:hypothetical protein